MSARVLGLGPIARPRLPTPFEPLSDPPSPPADFLPESETHVAPAPGMPVSRSIDRLPLAQSPLVVAPLVSVPHPQQPRALPGNPIAAVPRAVQERSRPPPLVAGRRAGSAPSVA